MNYKIFSFAVLSIFLLSFASAMTVYADFTTGEQTATVNVNQPISFNVDFFSMNPPMSMKIEVYKDGALLLPTFWSANTNGRIYYKTYSYTPTSSGTYEIRVIGTDKINTDYESLTLIVNPVTQPDTIRPVITLLGANPQTIIQGNLYTELGATATDNIDGDLTDEIIIDSSNVDTNVVGTYLVTYNVEDSSGNWAITKIRTVYVVSSTPTNHAPEITSSPVTSVTEGNNYYYDVDAEDDENDDLTYSLTEDSPDWLDINPNTGEITGTAPLVSSTEYYTVTVEVSDGNGGFDTQTYTLKVKNYVSGGITETSRGITEDFYYQNKYYDQFGTGKTIYTEKPVSNNINILILLYVILAIIGLGIVLIVFLLIRNLRR